MKKKRIVISLLILIIGTMLAMKAFSKTSDELSILEAIKLSYPSALKWDGNAQLLNAVNIDLEDKSEKSIGSNGKRKYWNISFGVPDTNKYFLVTVYRGKIKDTNDLTHPDDSPYPKKRVYCRRRY